MTDNFKKALEIVFRHEGGYVNDKDDLGGETNFGICKRYHPDEDIKNMTKERAAEIYHRDFWMKVQGDKINHFEKSAAIFDFAVNVGVKNAVAIAQMVSGATPDGIIGIKTIEAINKMDTELFTAEYIVGRVAYYVRNVKKRPVNQKFFYGWIRRAINDI